MSLQQSGKSSPICLHLLYCPLIVPEKSWLIIPCTHGKKAKSKKKSLSSKNDPSQFDQSNYAYINVQFAAKVS